MSFSELQTAHRTGYQPGSEAAYESFPRETSRASVDSAAFRSALSLLAAGTTVVTMCDRDGDKLGLTASSVTSVSLDPPLVLVCVNNRARTAAALQSLVPFIIHVLAADQAALARHFASPKSDKFVDVVHQMTASGCPQLDGVLTRLECVPHQIFPGGDHIIVIGRVVESHVNDEVLLPLIAFRSQFLNHITHNH